MGYFNNQHPTLLAEPVGPLDRTRGPDTAEVTLLEYGDFACPYCRKAYPAIKALLATHPDVRFVFRANPRSHLFPDAAGAAEAAEAAAAQGKFWEMHDRLFESEDGLGRAQLSAIARDLGLDVARFERELDGHAYKQAVHRQEIAGWHSHVISTPTFFIDGVRFEDSPDVLPAAILRAKRQQELIHAVYREAHVQSTGDRRRQVIAIGPHRLVADLPPVENGTDAGPGPHDLMLAALGACTAMTVQWSADKHKIPLRRVDIRLSQSHTATGHVFRQSVVVEGDITDAQLAQLRHVAEACPVSRTLTVEEVTIDTRLTLDGTVDEASRESFPASDPPPWTSGRER